MVYLNLRATKVGGDVKDMRLLTELEDINLTATYCKGDIAVFAKVPCAQRRHTHTHNKNNDKTLSGASSRIAESAGFSSHSRCVCSGQFLDY